MQQPHTIADGRYELLEELGHGGMGSVLRGYDSVLDRPVAVKLIRPEAVTSPHLAEEFVKRFQREARVTARIQHPGVPQVYDAGLDDALHRVFLVPFLPARRPAFPRRSHTRRRPRPDGRLPEAVRAQGQATAARGPHAHGRRPPGRGGAGGAARAAA